MIGWYFTGIFGYAVYLLFSIYELWIRLVMFKLIVFRLESKMLSPQKFIQNKTETARKFFEIQQSAKSTPLNK